MVISTGDKDLAQLVNPHVTLVNAMSNEVLDEAGVLAKFGVPPSASSTPDAGPATPWTTCRCRERWPKTAVKWLTQYGTLDNPVAMLTTSAAWARTCGTRFLPLGLNWSPCAATSTCRKRRPRCRKRRSGNG